MSDSMYFSFLMLDFIRFENLYSVIMLEQAHPLTLRLVRRVNGRVRRHQRNTQLAHSLVT